MLPALPPLIKHLFHRYLRAWDRYAAANPFTWVYGLARTVLALGGLITFLCSSTQTLFDRTLFGKLSLLPFFERINLFFLFGFDHLQYAQGLAVVILLLVVSGVAPRITGILHWWVAFSFQQAGTILEGGDQITAILTLLLIPIALCDNRKNHWAAPIPGASLYRNFIGNIFFTGIAVQMSILYFHAAVEKLYKSPEWLDGTAIYYFSKDPVFGFPQWITPFFDKILPEATMVSALTWSVILLELLLAGALFMSKTKRLILFPAATLFHLSIALLFGLVSFFFAMYGGLILYLIPRHLKFNFTSFAGLAMRKSKVPKLANNRPVAVT